MQSRPARVAGSGAPEHAMSGAAVALAFGLVLAFFWPTLWSFPGTWERYGMSHGWLIAGLVGWLAWRDRADLLAGRGGDLLLLLPLGALSLLWFAATVAHIQVIHQTSLALVLLCWGLVVFGWGAARTLAVLGATFMLGLPIWDVLVPALRSATTLASGALVRLLGIPAEIDGDIIHIGVGTFLVEDGCAGLNYLLSALVVGAIYAHVLVRGWRAQLAVLGAAAAFSILGNWVRVVALIVIGHVTEMQSGLMTRHLAFGWAVFTVSLVPFFVVARMIEKRASRKAAAAAAVAAREGATGWEAAEPVPASRGPDSRLKQVGLASVVAVLGPVLYFGVGALPAAGAGGPGLAGVPGGPGWGIVASPGERPFDWHPAYEGAEVHEVVEFTDGAARVYGDRFVYRKQAQGAKLIGYPNRIAPSADILDQRVVGPVDPAGSRWVRQAVVRTADGPVMTWYWYRVGGIEAFSPVQAKALEIPAFLGRRRASELIALSAPCETDGCQNAFAALAGVTGARRPPAPGDGR